MACTRPRSSAQLYLGVSSLARKPCCWRQPACSLHLPVHSRRSAAVWAPALLRALRLPSAVSASISSCWPVMLFVGALWATGPAAHVDVGALATAAHVDVGALVSIGALVSTGAHASIGSLIQCPAPAPCRTCRTLREFVRPSAPLALLWSQF